MKNIQKISRDQLIKEVGKASSLSYARTKSVFNNIEKSVMEHLQEANENTDVAVRILDGVAIYSQFQPEKTHNFLGNDIVVSERLKPKAIISRSYVRKLNG